MLNAVSAVGSASLYRELLIGCDAILIPESNGELRSIMLECMAAGVPTTAREDPALDMLGGAESQFILKSPKADDWATHLGHMLQEPQWARDMGQRARSVAAEQFRSSRHVERMIALMEHTKTGGTLQFQEHRPAPAE
jgi:glycosyltransferase involved in cell wall biosynthesis